MPAALITCVITAIAASSRSMSNWMSRMRNCPPECGACWPRSARTLPSSMAGSRWSSWPVCRSPPKAVERTAEAIGGDIEVRQQRELQQALQLDLPLPLGPRIPLLYIEMDGTGIPVVRQETEGRPGKQDGQPAHTREAKLGCVFTQGTMDEEGYPIRDGASTSYVGAIETAAEFGRRLYAEAWRRGWAQADKKVVLGDGAEWIWNQADLHFPDTTQIVDFYHARQHLWELAAKLYPNDLPSRKRWVIVEKDKLDSEDIESSVAALHSLEASYPALRNRFRRKPTTSTVIKSACVIPSSANNDYLWALE
jgi:hypothetical protein